jgi:hypothetical protein
VGFPTPGGLPAADPGQLTLVACVTTSTT